MKDHLLRDPIYMKCPDQASPSEQKVHQWLPGVGGWNGDSLLMERGFPFEA